jgi:hypothetical protein
MEGEGVMAPESFRKLYNDMIPLTEVCLQELLDKSPSNLIPLKNKDSHLDIDFVRFIISEYEVESSSIIAAEEEASDLFTEYLFVNNGISEITHKIERNYIDTLKTIKIISHLDPTFAKIDAFSVVDWGSKEVSHTKMLAFFLNPRNPHHLGDLPLKYFLSHLSLDESFFFDCDICDLLKCNADTVITKEEYRIPIGKQYKHLDIYISFDNHTHILIEGKIKSRESNDQLTDYANWVDEKACPNLKLFLTPKGQKASDDRWRSYSWNDIRHAFSAMLNNTPDNSPGQRYGLWLCRLWLSTIIHEVLKEDHIDYEPYNNGFFDKYSFDELRRLSSLTTTIHNINNVMNKGGK